MWFRKKKPAPTRAKVERKKAGIPDLSGIDASFDAQLDEFVKKNAIQVDAPRPVAIEGAAMDSDTSAAIMAPSVGYVNQRTLAYYIASSSFIGYYNCALVAQHWLVAKGCSLKAKDAVKKWFEVSACDGEELKPAQIKYIEKCNKAYKLKENLVQAETFNNIFGIRHILFKNKNPNFDYSKPFNPDSWGAGEYAGMSQVDPMWITPVIEDMDLTDPTRIGFYEPTYWLINGKQYHKSHFVILKGEEVADYLKPTYRYGGVGLAQRIYERVYAAESTANEGPQLAKTKRLTVQKVDVAKVQADKKAFMNALNTFQKLRDNYGTKFIGKDDEVQQIDTNLADLDSTITGQYALVCSTCDAPVSKMMGTGHPGFGTGDTDDDYWIQSLEVVQGGHYGQIIEAHFARLIPSELTPKAGITCELDVKWNPIRVMSDNELADVRLKDSTMLANLYNTGAIDNVDVREFIITNKMSGFEGLKMPDEIIEQENSELD